MSLTDVNSIKTDSTLRAELEAMRSELHGLRESVTSLGHSAARAAKAGAGDARHRVEEAVHTAKAKGKEAAEHMEEKIEENPLLSVGVAFGLGLLLGAILRK